MEKFTEEEKKMLRGLVAGSINSCDRILHHVDLSDKKHQEFIDERDKYEALLGKVRKL